MNDYELECGQKVMVNGERGTLLWFDSEGYYVDFDKDILGMACVELYELKPVTYRGLARSRKGRKQ